MGIQGAGVADRTIHAFRRLVPELDGRRARDDCDRSVGLESGKEIRPPQWAALISFNAARTCGDPRQIIA